MKSLWRICEDGIRRWGRLLFVGMHGDVAVDVDADRMAAEMGISASLRLFLCGGWLFSLPCSLLIKNFRRFSVSKTTLSIRGGHFSLFFFGLLFWGQNFSALLPFFLFRGWKIYLPAQRRLQVRRKRSACRGFFLFGGWSLRRNLLGR